MKKIIISIFLISIFLMTCRPISASAGDVRVYHTGSASHYASFNTIAEAIKSTSLQNGDIIELNSNTTEISNATINKNDITLCSAPGSHYTADYSGLSISSAANAITITGTNVTISGITFQNFTSTFNGVLIGVNTSGNAYFGGGAIFQNNDGRKAANGASIIVTSGSAYVDGASFYNNKAMHGAAIYVDTGAYLEVNDTPNDGYDTIFLGNEVIDAGGCGGAITNKQATIIIKGGTYTDNYGKFGGVIYSTGNMTITGGVFRHNFQAVVSSNFEYTKITGTPLFENNYGLYGSALQFQTWNSGHASEAYIEGGTFKNNIADADGGAVTVRCSNKYINLIISGGVFTGNKATSESGDAHGGAINLTSEAVVTISGGEFINNTAKTAGNAVDQGGTLYLSGSPTFGNNQDVYLHSGKTITKNGELLSRTSVTMESETNGADVLVSQTGKVVSNEDLTKLNIILNNEVFTPEYNANGNNDSSAPVKNVIELRAYATIKIERTGLLEGESVIYKIYDGSNNLKFTLPLASGEPDIVVNRLEAGTYSVVEDIWNWSYEKETPTVSKSATTEAGKATFSISAGELVTCTFSGAKKSVTPLHGERIKNNSF